MGILRNWICGLRSLGGDRLGQNLYANCVLALNARTGEKIWHYQVVHHDIWDYDIASPPNLVEVEVAGNFVGCGSPTHENGAFICLEPGNRRANISGRGSPRAPNRNPWRRILADPAFSPKITPICPTKIYRGRGN